MSIEDLLTELGFVRGDRSKKFGFASRTSWTNRKRGKVETHTAMGEIVGLVLFVGGREVAEHAIRGFDGFGFTCPDAEEIAEIRSKMDLWFTQKGLA